MTETAVRAAVRRDRAIVITAIVAISVLAWAYTLWLAAHMSMMDMSPPAPAQRRHGRHGCCCRTHFPALAHD